MRFIDESREIQERVSLISPKAYAVTPHDNQQSGKCVEQQRIFVPTLKDRILGIKEIRSIRWPLMNGRTAPRTAAMDTLR